jgi:hypothetical protein
MITPLPLYFIELLVLILPLMQDVAKLSQRKSEKLKAVVSGLQELQVKDKCISEELTKNIYLQRELDKLKLERTEKHGSSRTTSATSRRPTSSSRNNSKSRKRRIKASPFFPRILSLSNLS